MNREKIGIRAGLGRVETLEPEHVVDDEEERVGRDPILIPKLEDESICGVNV